MGDKPGTDLREILTELGLARSNRRCGRPTRRGTPCKSYCGEWEVACAWHITPAERAEREEQMRRGEARRQAIWEERQRRDREQMAIDPRGFYPGAPIPVCHAWEPPAADQPLGWDLLMEWHQDRCAICGALDGGSRGLKFDHCHDSGMVRGLLCASCNLREGHDSGRDEKFTLYRDRPPALIVGWTFQYNSPFTPGPERWAVLAFGDPPEDGPEAAAYLQRVRQRLVEDPAVRTRHLKPRGPAGHLRRNQR